MQRVKIFGVLPVVVGHDVHFFVRFWGHMFRKT